MWKLVDKNQTSLDIVEIWEEIEVRKQRRKTQLKGKSKRYFAVQQNQLTLENLIKLTYDITDKDFEYLYEELLKMQWYESTKVIWWKKDGWVDVRAYKDGIWHFIQCKQWSSINLSLEHVWVFYAKMHTKMKRYPRAKFSIVTTSYFDSWAKEFLLDHGIECIDNIWLMNLCDSFNIFDSEEKWQEIRMAIYRKRLEKMRDELNPKQKLKDELKKEIIHHLPENMRLKRLSFSSQKSKSYVSEFFQIIDSL